MAGFKPLCIGKMFHVKLFFQKTNFYTGKFLEFSVKIPKQTL